jgi:8-oxo-dGTP pyrophosphatase MutT (NUDIX family)
MEIQLHTPSAGGIVIDDSRVLLIHSASKNTYEFPKGTIDEGETKDYTAIREVKEETGYTVEIVGFIGDETYEFNSEAGVRFIKTVTYYLMVLADAEAPRPNLQEGEDFVNKWSSFDEAMDLLTYDNSKELLVRTIQNFNLST